MPVAAPRVTTRDAFEGEPTTLEGSILANGFQAIGRAGGMVPATHGQKWRQSVLIHLDQGDKQVFQAVGGLSSRTKRSSAGTSFWASTSDGMISLAE